MLERNYAYAKHFSGIYSSLVSSYGGFEVWKAFCLDPSGCRFLSENYRPTIHPLKSYLTKWPFLIHSAIDFEVTFHVGWVLGYWLYHVSDISKVWKYGEFYELSFSWHIAQGQPGFQLVSYSITSQCFKKKKSLWKLNFLINKTHGHLSMSVSYHMTSYYD